MCAILIDVVDLGIKGGLVDIVTERKLLLLFRRVSASFVFHVDILKLL